MLSLLTLQQECIKAYRRYADTVAVLSAIYHILRKEPRIADFVGIEPILNNANGHDVTPDLAALCESRSKGLIFEFKWSLPFSEKLLRKEVEELGKYAVPCTKWRNSSGKVDYHDLILVCNIEDVERTVDMIKKIALVNGFAFLASDGFAVLAWVIQATRSGERKEHMILLNNYGKIRNATLDTMLRQSPGLILPEGALTYLRSTFSFIREKPPVQYTIIELVQHVFPQFQDPVRGHGAIYEITTDMIYDKAKTLFPSWDDFDTQTANVKRAWISEALDVMFTLNLIGKPVGKPNSWLIPIPTLRTREPIQSSLCRKLARHQLKLTKKPSRKGRPRVQPLRLKAHPKTKRLEDFF